MEKIKIIIDTDIGDDIDDAMALAYAVRRPELQILGITTVWGDVDTRARMAAELLAKAGRPDIPVFAGCSETLCGGMKKRGHINHTTKDTSRYSYRTDKHGVDFIIDTLLAAEEKITLVPIGAMTNIAMALIKCPKIKEKIERVVWMGGAFYFHCLTWNALCDPDALRFVFESGLPITAVSRDVCQTCAMTAEQTQRLLHGKDALQQLLAEQITMYRENFREPILFDPLTITAVFDESLLTFKEEAVLVETRGEFTRGMTFAVGKGYDNSYMLNGKYPRFADIPRIRVACRVDAQAYIEHYIDCVMNSPVCPA